MIYPVIGVVLAAILAIVFWVRDKRPSLKMAVLAAIPLAAGLLASTMTTVPTGYTGIVTTFGEVSPNTLEAGLHFKSPVQEVVLMDNRTQKVSGTAAAFSQDIQQVSIVYSVNYNIDKAAAFTLYQNVGQTFFDTVVTPRLLEGIKGTTSKYTAENLVENRTELSVKIAEVLKAEMQAYGINIITVNIEDIDFTDAFTDAVEAKQVAEQTLIKTKTEQEQAIVIANTEAQKKVIAAEAEANSIRIAAQAEADRIRIEAEARAKANEVIAQSLNDDVLRYQSIEKWDGAMPRYMSGDAALPFIQIGGINESSE